jgi:phosphoribosylcarboxyaminoimidazole (NCAIR) mutase
MKKILFLAAGSNSDPGFDGIYDKEEMKKNGIRYTEPTVIESCHGCFDKMTEHSREMEEAVINGNRVVGVLNGGLLFALPSIQATQTTYPIVSVPLDFYSYVGYAVPSGTAVIGTVGIEKSDAMGYDTRQRKNALKIAENMLNLGEDTVSVKGEYLDEIEEVLGKFNIKTSADSNLVLNFGPWPQLPNRDEEVQVWAHSLENPSPALLEENQQKLWSSKNTVQVRGKKNLVNYAAKIISLQRPDVRELLIEMGEKKRQSYEDRNLLKELGL